MADVSTIANYAEIFGAIVVVGGLAFAAYELRQVREQNEHAREQRRQDAAFEMFNSMMSKEFIHGINMLYNMPEGLGTKEMEEEYPDDMESIRWVLTQFEQLGTMVFKHVVPFDLAEDFFQVSAVNAWTKMRAYIEEMRDNTGKGHLYFFVQWMAERLLERDKQTADIIEEARNWRPE